MIARISLYIALLILLPDAYLYCRHVRRKRRISCTKKLLWWLPSAILLVGMLPFVLEKDFLPRDTTLLNVYLFLLGCIAVPKLLVTLFSLIFLPIGRLLRTKHDYGAYFGALIAAATLYVLCIGTFVGPKQLTVNRITLCYDDLPPAFDGYTMVLFADTHIGTMPAQLMPRVADSIAALNADIVLFAGDIQNIRPEELEGWHDVFASITAPDGVYAVLGNHDYGTYIGATSQQKTVDAERETITHVRSYGWHLLLNEHAAVSRNGDTIYIAGEENGGKPPFLDKSNIKNTLQGVPEDAFVVLMQHDPSAWRRHILSESTAQLTLSGHTHGGQISLFGWRPTQFSYEEDCGLYEEGGRHLFVTTGLGGALAFRYNMTPEIVVITLRNTNAKTTAQ